MKIKEFFFTGFYSGYIPFAPGTMGTIIAMLIFGLEYLLFGYYSWIVNAVFVVIFFYPSIWLGNHAEKFFGKEDPSEVVLDEMMGYWIAVMFHPFSLTVAILGFVFFRMFDILKPFPVNRMEKLHGGLGIMADDYMAGLLANLVIIGFKLFSYYSGVEIFIY